MKFRVDDSKKFLVLVESTSSEYDQLQYSFTKKLYKRKYINKNYV